MEISESTSWPFMILIALALGLRHGFDLDHIATIDAITRTARSNRKLSKLTGLLFSFGHGVVVTLISLMIGGGLMHTRIPQWLDGFGNAISIFFLIGFGILNLWNIFQKEPRDIPIGIKSFLAKRILNKKFNPFLIMGVGALFAFSFDTFSQIALFSISASLLAGWLFSGVLGLFFTIGMMLSDSLNGLLVSIVIQRADRASLILSRGLGLTISAFSLTIGILGLLRTLK